MNRSKAILALAAALLVRPALADFASASQAYERRDYSSAFVEFTRLALQGDARAQRQLGIQYEHGQGVAADLATAEVWYRMAADQGDADASRNLMALRARRGAAVPAREPAAAAQAPKPVNSLAEAHAAYSRGDTRTAYASFLKAAREGSAEAQIGLAEMLAEGIGVGKNDAEAVSWYRKAAEQGAPIAQYVLGNRYREGRGVAADPAQAADWYRKSAERGYARGQYNLGAMLMNGDGIPKDESQALDWFLKAARQGDANAQNVEGLAYRDGIGVPADDERAYFWFSLAAMQDMKAAIGNRDALAGRLTDEQRAQAQAELRDWLGSKPERR